MMNLDEFPSIGTDPFVFKVLGNGDFHLSSEAFMEFSGSKKWSYVYSSIFKANNN